MRGDLFDGWVQLAGQFPPSLNKEEDPTRLKPFESPDCYGVDPDKDGRLKSGSVPSGTARSAPTRTIGSTTYYWYYDRLWRLSATSQRLLCGIPSLDTVFLKQAGAGPLLANSAIVTYLPCLQDAMLVVTATGSHLANNVKDPRGFFELGPFLQEMYASTASHVTVLDGIPFVCNAAGVFSYDGQTVKEWTRPVRDSVSPFASTALTCVYPKKYVVGTSKFVIDTTNGKLFNFGTSGFRFTSRTLAVSEEYSPFMTQAIAFILEHGDTTGGTISWQSKAEDGNWYSEPDINVRYTEGQYTRIETGIRNPTAMARRFAIRITALDSSLYIRDIVACVGGFTQNSFAA